MISGPIPSPGRTTMWGVASLLMPAALYGLGSGGDGRDVEADEAQGQRLAGRRQDVGDELLVQVGGQRVDLRLEDQGPHELAGVGRRHLPGLQPRLDLVEAGGAEPLLGVLGATVEPGLLELGQARGVGLPLGDLARAAAELVDVAAAAALGLEAGARLQ